MNVIRNILTLLLFLGILSPLTVMADHGEADVRDTVDIYVNRSEEINDVVMGPGRDFGTNHSGCNPPYPPPPAPTPGHDWWDQWINLVDESQSNWLKLPISGNFWEDTEAWEWFGSPLDVPVTGQTLILGPGGPLLFGDLSVGMEGRFECVIDQNQIVTLKITIYEAGQEWEPKNGFSGVITNINSGDQTLQVEMLHGTSLWPVGRGNDDANPFTPPSQLFNSNYAVSRWYWNSNNAGKKSPLNTFFALLDFCEENDIWVQVKNWDTLDLNGPSIASTHPERYDEVSDYPIDQFYTMDDYYDDVNEFGEYIAAILYYLKVEANNGFGYDCIKSYAICNEPGTHWGHRIFDFDHPGSYNLIEQSVDAHLEFYGTHPGCRDIRSELIKVGQEGEPFYRTGAAAGYDRQNWTEMIGRGLSTYDQYAPGNLEPNNYNCFTTGRLDWPDGDAYFQAIGIHDYYSAFDYDRHPGYTGPFELNGVTPTIEDYLLNYKTISTINQLDTYDADGSVDGVFASEIGSFNYRSDLSRADNSETAGGRGPDNNPPRFEQSLYIAEATLRLFQIENVWATSRWNWNAHRHWAEAEYPGCWYHPEAPAVDVVPVNFYPYKLVSMAIPRDSKAYETVVVGDIADTSCGYPYETSAQRVWAGAFAGMEDPNQLLVVSDSCAPKNLNIHMNETIEDLTKYWVCEADYPEGGTPYRGIHMGLIGNVSDFNDTIHPRSIVLYRSANDAEYLPDSTDVPGEVLVGSGFGVEIYMKNTGSTTWTRGAGYTLRSVNEPNPWGPMDVRLPNDVPPGETVRFSFLLRAPKELGYFPFGYRMQKNNMFFGEATDIPDIKVLLKFKPTPTPTFTPSPTPTPTPQTEFSAVIPFWQNDPMFYSFYTFKNSATSQSVNMEMKLLNAESTPVAVFNQNLIPGQVAMTTTRDGWYTCTTPEMGAARIHLDYNQPPDTGDVFHFWSAIVNSVAGFPPGWTICPVDSPVNPLISDGPKALQNGTALIPYWENGGTTNALSFFSLYNPVPEGSAYGVPVNVQFHFRSMDGQNTWSKAVFLKSGEFASFCTLGDPDLNMPSGLWGAGTMDIQFGPGYNPGMHQIYVWSCVAGATALDPDAQVGYTVPLENPMSSSLYPPSCQQTEFNILVPYWKVDTASGMHFCTMLQNTEDCSTVDATLKLYSVNADHSLTLEATYTENTIAGGTSRLFNTWNGGINGSHEGIGILTLDYGANSPALTDILSVWSLTYQYAPNSYCSGVPAESPYTAIRPYILNNASDEFVFEGTHEIPYWEEATASTTIWTIWNCDTSQDNLTPTIMLYDVNGSLVSSVAPSTPIEPGEAWIINTDQSWYTGGPGAASGLISMEFDGPPDEANRAYVYESVNGTIGNGSIDGYEVKIR